MNDDIDHASTDDAGQAIIRAIGRQLRLARRSHGWTRPQLVQRLPTRMPVNTIGGYEQGIRQCSIPRLVEICHALETDLPDLLGRALHSLGLRDRSALCEQCDREHRIYLDEIKARLRVLEDHMFPETMTTPTATE